MGQGFSVYLPSKHWSKWQDETSNHRYLFWPFYLPNSLFSGSSIRDPRQTRHYCGTTYNGSTLSRAVEPSPLILTRIDYSNCFVFAFQQVRTAWNLVQIRRQNQPWEPCLILKPAVRCTLLFHQTWQTTQTHQPQPSEMENGDTNSVSLNFPLWQSRYRWILHTFPNSAPSRCWTRGSLSTRLLIHHGQFAKSSPVDATQREWDYPEWYSYFKSNLILLNFNG